MFLMLLMIAIPLSAQEGQQWILSDSLYQGTPGDTINVYNIGLQYDLLVLTKKDTGSTYIDTFKVELGTIYEHPSPAPAETLWVTAPLKDSTFGNPVYSLFKAAGNIEAVIWCPGVQLVRVSLINSVYVLNRKAWYAIKKCHRW